MRIRNERSNERRWRGVTRAQMAVLNDELNRIGLENIQNIILIENGATNGDVIKAMFPNIKFDEYYEEYRGYDNTEKFPKRKIEVDNEWWNAPYERSDGV